MTGPLQSRRRLSRWKTRMNVDARLLLQELSMLQMWLVRFLIRNGLWAETVGEPLCDSQSCHANTANELRHLRATGRIWRQKMVFAESHYLSK